jgi:hypothetical protein
MSEKQKIIKFWNSAVGDLVCEQLKKAYAVIVMKKPPRTRVEDIVLPEELETKLQEVAHRWWEDENSCNFFIGKPDYAARPAMILAVEAARCMCRGNNRAASKLLKMAVKELQTMDPRKKNWGEPLNSEYLDYPNNGNVEISGEPCNDK